MTTATSHPPRTVSSDGQVPDCPYVGLVPFDEEAAAFFFGRNRDAELIVANLMARRLTLLYAASGVGKSSVLRAGVLPRLRLMAEDDIDDEDVPTRTAAVAYVGDWSTDPLETAGEAIRAAVARAATGKPQASGPARLRADWLGSLLDDSGVAVLYLILDQFEEYFFYHPADDAGDPLTAELGQILTARHLNVHVLISIRDDSVAGLDRFKGRVPQLFGNYLRLAHLDRDAATAAIRGPLAEYNRRVPDDAAMAVDPRLVDDLLEQVRDGSVVVDPDASPSSAADAGDRRRIEAPYLQLVLTRIWDQERARGSHVLLAATLKDLGGAEAIVRSHLATVVTGLAPPQVPVAAAVFRHLVTASGSKIAYTASDLAAVSGQPERDIASLLEALTAGRRRILRPVPPAAGSVGPPRYEIFHDVMGKAVLEWRRQYVAEQRRQKDSERLVAEREKARLDARVARRQLRDVLLCVGLVIALVLAAGAASALWRASIERKQQELLAQAATALERNPDLSRTFAIKAYQLGNNPATRSALLEAASVPQSSVVVQPGAAPDATLIGMKVAADRTSVVGYARGGRLVVVPRSGEITEHSVAGLRGAVIDVAPAPDASHVAVATDQGEVAVIDMASGKRTELATDLKGGGTVQWLGDDATGSVLVVGADKARAATFSSVTGAALVEFPATVAAAGIDGGRHVVTSAADKRLRVWDAAVAGPPLKESDAFPTSPMFLDEDGPRIVAVTNFASANSNVIGVWDWHSATAPVMNTFNAQSDVQAVRLDKTAKNLAQHSVIVAAGKVVWQFFLADGRIREVFPGQNGWVKDVAASADGNWTATAHADGLVCIWSERGDSFPIRATYALAGDGGSVAQVAFIDKDVIAREDNGTLRRWSLPQAQRFSGHKSWVLDTDASRDGREIATASADGFGYVLDSADPTRRTALFGDGNALAYVRFDPTDAHRVYTLGRDETKSPRAWHWPPGKDGNDEPIRYAPVTQGGDNSLTSLAVSSDGGTLVAGDTGGGIHFWDSRTGKLLTERELPGTGYAASGMAFDPTGRALAITDHDGIRLVDPASPDRLLTRLLLVNPTDVAFDPSGRYVAAVADGGRVAVWSTTTFQEVTPSALMAHSSRLGRPSFSPDGRLLAAGTADGRVEIWEVETGVTVSLTRQHGDFVNSVRFLAGPTTRLVTASDDHTVAEWSCPACDNQQQVIDDAINER